jgi:uncharacterized protein DUF4157
MKTPEAAEQKEAAVSAARAPAPQASTAAEHGSPRGFLTRLHSGGGNRAAGQWLQAKLKIGAAHDPYEQEADRAADQVMRMPDPALEVKASPPLVQRKCAQCEEEDHDQLQRKCAHCEEEDSGQLQRQESGSGGVAGAAPSIVHESLSSAGHPLDTATRAFMEPRFGHDFGRVRVRTDAQAAAAAQAVRAKAFTVGADLVFGAGEYAPGTPGGRLLLAHELAHVIQQSGGGTMLQRAENDTVPNCAPLTDTETDVDAKVNAALANARKAAGASPTGRQVAKGVVKELATDTSMGRTAIEDWASTLSKTKADLPAQSATKYAGVTYGLWKQPFFPILNPTMKIHAICVGSDKLGHFFQQGATFYQTQSLKGTAAAEEQSERTEGGGYGLATTGVFSNADREANRQGAKFYADLVASPTMTFAIASYISSAWSEVDHPNFYESSVGHQVWANVLAGKWSGHSWDNSPFADNPLTLDLKATVAGSVTGTFTVGGASGTLTGTITYNTTTVKGETTMGSPTTETPISGIRINFDWTMGSDSGKGFLDSGGERHLGGSWGRGKSDSDRGTWYIDHT